MSKVSSRLANAGNFDLRPHRPGSQNLKAISSNTPNLTNSASGQKQNFRSYSMRLANFFIALKKQLKIPAGRLRDILEISDMR